MFGFKSHEKRDCEILNTILTNLPTHRAKKVEVHWEYISNGMTGFEAHHGCFRPRVTVELYEYLPE